MNEEASALMGELSMVADMLEGGKLLALFIGILGIWAANWILRQLAEGVMKRLPSRRFIILQFVTLTSFILYIGGVIVLIVAVLQPPREFLLAIAGSAAVAIGFALKDIASSLVAGILLLFERPFQVGDRVTYGETYGTITAITLRSVRLQTLDDNTVTIPNSSFITDIVSSGNMGAMDMMVTADFHLALDADVDKAEEILQQVIVTSRFTYLKKPIKFIVEEVEIAERIAIRLRARAYVLDVDYEKPFLTDITRRVSKLFIEAGIERPSRL
ncbi:small-conductance mechanosensitive channel [Luminiphilus syltensis NOR5-1B]|uniref:Small-conductance mechanosensitive channel n=1 Tax=Luminiphilus syltensis NOR5-1B TaxID=565045 RepID=B8KVF7_9GAMM|nr:mechanosensitive ion channel domain-containing protein [Luminiphilus syltensis]EED34509.1 small-conductance mechanosensitive channel [Luminiphilus syltensis NOR5-1B]